MGRKSFHSFETMRRLKASALPTGMENLTPPSAIGRRNLLKAMLGASAALAVGAPGCERKPKRQIISRVSEPEYTYPGKVLYYSSTWMEGPIPYGMMVKTVDGRPIKIEGNPEHPLNGGSSSAQMQASLLSLYDPDRLRAPQRGGKAISWAEADRQAIDALGKASSVAIMTRSTLGPSERSLIAKFLSLFKNGRHIIHETAQDVARRAATQKLFGKPGIWEPRICQARCIVSFDSDFLGTDGVVLENVQAFADAHQLDDDKHAEADLPRLYVFESAYTLTGSNADHRLAVRPSIMGELAGALRKAVAGDERWLDDLADRYRLPGDLLLKCARDLKANKSKSVIVTGPHLPAAVQAQVALLNNELDAYIRTLAWNPVPPGLPATPEEEAEKVLAGGADVLICLSVNPVYDWPGGDFKSLIGKAKLSIAHSLYPDETASACMLALPSCHNLESWNDAGLKYGLASICQPVISPLFGSRQEANSLLKWTQVLAGDPIDAFKDFHDYVRWQNVKLGNWEDLLRQGGLLNAAIDYKTMVPSLNRDEAERMAGQKIEPGEFEVVIRPHHAIHDGRFANNAWLQELPDPVSKIVWDNVAMMSPAAASKLGLAEGDNVTVKVGDHSVTLPAAVQRGIADGVVALTLGHGRTAGGVVAIEAGGANVAPLLGREDANSPHLALEASVTLAEGSRKIVRPQMTFHTEDRPVVIDGTLDEYHENANFVKHRRHIPEMTQLYKGWDYSKGHKWGMAIDLNRCVGCEACVAACQAENNIPIVGREQVGRGRIMHWIRIDRYEDGPPDNLRIHHEPMLCQHCDNAPCENVCPVNATAHSPEGLNEMAYNRCVGTRYCSNNCPYKVRRFNFLRYHEAVLRDPVQELAFNPQVTVRGVGVMEKCTFCVQRINAAKFAASNAGVKLKDGAIQTACAQACPAGAIVFGDLNDPTSEIARWHASQRAFWVMQELNTAPNVTYLAKVRNPAKALEVEQEHRGTLHE